MTLQKKAWRRIRSRRKRKLLHGGSMTQEQHKKYHLKSASYYIQRRSRANPAQLEKHTIIVPQSFSFIDNANETTQFLRKLKKLLCKNVPKNLSIDHSGVKKIDLAASFHFDKLITDYCHKWRLRGIHVQTNGRLPQNKEINNFLLSFGLLEKLHIKNDFPSQIADQSCLDMFVIFKENGSRLEEFKKSQATSGLVDFFNKSFNENNLQLTEDGASKLLETFGEIVDNAEAHCGPFNQNGKWHCLGCYSKNTRECSFAIINEGCTIYENLQASDNDSREAIRKIFKTISSKRDLFNLSICQFSEEPIFNIMALQQGISSRRTNQGNRRSTCGYGMMTVLDFINSVRSEKKEALVSVVSGKSQIYVDYRYPIVKKRAKRGNSEITLLYFNKKNELDEPPDSDCAILLDGKYPGLAFSGRFTIDESYLRRRLQGD